jgi:hypothetical protein
MLLESLYLLIIIKFAHILLLFYLPKEWVKSVRSLRTNSEKKYLLHLCSQFGVENIYSDWPTILPVVTVGINVPYITNHKKVCVWFYLLIRNLTHMAATTGQVLK